jgi:hypothetical protein
MPFFGAGNGYGAPGALGAHQVDRVFKFDLPANPEAASMMSLDYIHALARDGREDPIVRRQAFTILRQAGVREKDYPGMIVAIHRWIQRHLYYMHDPTGTEMLTQARVLLAQIERGEAVEDCDSFVLLEHALLNAVGIPTQSVIWKADRRDPTQWSHITLEAHDGRRWVSLDPIMKDKPVGWAPPKFYGRRVVPVGDGPPFPRRDGLSSGGTVEHFPRGQARQSMAGWFSGASNMVGWRGFAGYGADAASGPAAGPTPAMTAKAAQIVAAARKELRELVDMRTEAIAAIDPLLRSIEPLAATAEAAGARLADQAKVAAKVGEVVKYVGIALSLLSGVTAGISEIVNVAIQVGNMAYQTRQAAAAIGGSAGKTLNEVSSAFSGIESGINAAVEITELVQGQVDSREKLLSVIYTYYPDLAPPGASPVLAVQVAPETAAMTGAGVGVGVAVAAAAGLVALAMVL